MLIKIAHSPEHDFENMSLKLQVWTPSWNNFCNLVELNMVKINIIINRDQASIQHWHMAVHGAKVGYK